MSIKMARCPCEGFALAQDPQIRDAGSRAPGGVTASEGDDSMNGYSAHGASNGVKRDATSGPETTSSQGIIASDADEIVQDAPYTARRIGPTEPDDTMVICPVCTSQFRAIPLDVQRQLAFLGDLLALAKRMLAAWEGSGPGIVLDDIRALIAKAEGRSDG